MSGLDRRTFLAGTGVPSAFVAAGGRCRPSAESYAVEGLRTEQLEGPIGIEAVRPRFSWRVISSDRGVRQSAWRVIVASSADALAAGRGDLWDSGRIASTLDIAYAGRIDVDRCGRSSRRRHAVALARAGAAEAVLEELGG